MLLWYTEPNVRG